MSASGACGTGSSFSNSRSKKSAAEQDRSDVAQARDEWRASQSELNLERLVFIDETGAATDMARRYGRCPRGQRLVSSVPWGHWKTTTFVGALRVGEIAAPCVFDGPMDGPSFRAYVERFVVPILRQGDIVVMDNLPRHKVVGICEAIEAAGAELRTCPRTAQTSTPSNSSSLNSKPCCERSPPEPSKRSLQQSPKPSPKSVRKSAKTTLLTKAIAANYESALSSEMEPNNSRL
jgi:transposase